MKGRESGMPDEDYWSTFFQPEGILDALGVVRYGRESAVEFGSGYGTFCLPLARRTGGRVLGLDIEPELVAQLRATTRQENLGHLEIEERDFVTAGTGLPDASVDRVLLYNILHIEQPVALLAEARRILRPGGEASVIHWRSDIPTPRGPSLAIRPSAAQCLAWAAEAGFQGDIRELGGYAPYHFGMVLSPK